MRMAKHLYTRRCPANRIHVQATGPQMHDNTHFPACGAPPWQLQAATCGTVARVPLPSTRSVSSRAEYVYRGSSTVSKPLTQRCIVARMIHTGGALM